MEEESIDKRRATVAERIIDAETGEIVETGDAWERHRRIVDLRNLTEQSFLRLGEELYHFEKDKQYKMLGHPTFEAYLADPDVDIARTTAFRLKGIYTHYVLELKVPPVGLLPAGNAKLDLMSPHMTSENVDEWVSTAGNVSRSDLKLLLEEQFGPGEAPPLPFGKYRVLYADPPWQYSNSGLGGAAAKHYPTMSTDAICEMPVAEHVPQEAALFLWTTNSHLPDALRVMAAWGFEYKANMVWVKDRPSYGKLAFYFRGQHEFLMLGIRGSLRPMCDPLPVSVLEAPKGEHSRKPDCVYEMIEAMYQGPHLELFARRRHEGWESFGNELPE